MKAPVLACALLAAVVDVTEANSLNAHMKPTTYKVVESDRDVVLKTPRVDDFY